MQHGSSTAYPLSHFLDYSALAPAYKHYVCQITTEKEPTTYAKAAIHDHWRKAISAELHAMEENKTWSVVPLPSGRKSVGCKWIFKIKYNADGSIERYKARLVAQGFTQQPGLDFT